MATQSQEAARLILRLDHLPFSGWHRRLFVLAFVGVMFDAMDFAMFGAVIFVPRSSTTQTACV